MFIIRDRAASSTLCIPSVFIGYNGEALDEMTPLLRSSDVLSDKAIELLELLGDKGVYRVYHHVRPRAGVLPDRPRALRAAPRSRHGRPHARSARRRRAASSSRTTTSVGIPERVQACIAEVEHELYKLGVPIMTRHNEVAPSQFEMAPRLRGNRHRRRSQSARHGHAAPRRHAPRPAGAPAREAVRRHQRLGQALQLVDVVASDNGLDGLNLLKPGRRRIRTSASSSSWPRSSRRVHKHAGLLRAGIATSGNEHRLGANEAPPAIISVFMGDMLTQLIENIADGQSGRAGAEQELIKLGVNKLPEIEKDNTDRNRTSPFAFTGNKFEYPRRWLVAVDRVSDHAAQRDRRRSHRRDHRALKAEKKKTKNIDDAVMMVVREVFRETKPVRFEGNNYAESWVKEAAKRGLPNFRRTPEALASSSPSSRASYSRSSAFSRRKSSSRATMCVSSAT